MNSSTPPRRRRDHPQLNVAWKALLWFLVIALAIFPLPWIL